MGGSFNGHQISFADAFNPNIGADPRNLSSDQQASYAKAQQDAKDKPSKKSAGKPPDYQDAAQQQAASSQQNVSAQTQQNRPNITTPFGSQTWTTGPDGTPRLTMGLAGGLDGAATSLEGQLQNNFSRPLDNGSAARDQAINAAYGQATSRLDPMWAQNKSQMDALLAAQGFTLGDEGYRNATGNFDRAKNDAYVSALNNAIGQGTQAQQVTFGENLAARDQPLSELGSIQGLASGMPQFNQAGLADPLQALAATQGQTAFNQGQAQLQNQLWTSGIGAVGQVAAGAARMSDERAKTNIVRLPLEALPGVPLATWDWRPGFEDEGNTVGVIAQDLAKVAPEYVSSGKDGYLRVDYGFLEEDR